MAEDQAIAVPATLQDLTGQTFGRWTVVGYAGRRGKNNRPHWHCLCACAARTTRAVNGDNLTRDLTQSCGCVGNERIKGMKASLWKPSEIVVGDNGIATVALTKGLVAIIDAADVPLVENYKWYARVDRYTSYAASAPRANTQIHMHRLILGVDTQHQVDHKDHNGLNNRRGNLRVCTQSQNLANQRPRRDGTSRYRGVSWNNKHQRWEANISVDNHQQHLGSFRVEEDAARAYDAAAREAWGEFAHPNFPES